MPEHFGSKSKLPLHAGRIEDYAMIGDLQTAALVSRTGSIDWLCWPTFSSGACFAALLGTKENGFWGIAPKGEIRETRRRYRQDTMILETTFATEDGEVELIDFMPPRGKHSDVVRMVRGVKGKVEMRLDLVLRFDYGLTVPWVTMAECELRAIAGPNMVILRSHTEGGKAAVFKGEDLTTTAEWTLEAGETIYFTLTYGISTEEVPAPVPIEEEIRNTERFWTEWSAKSKYNGPYREIVQRSLLTLKALTFDPTGGMIAAPTAGLPEALGGERNWDYRYCWLRDTAFTLLIFMIAGYTDEGISWRGWLLRAIAGAPHQVQALYGIRGERRLEEWNASWLPGYENSSPVRIGNAASEQFQLDIYGEVGVALDRIPQVDNDLRTPATKLEASLINHLCNIWPLPDDGIWETRGGRQQFVHSKVMAWVALDRAVKHHDKYDGAGDVKLWRKNRDLLRKEILKKGFNKRLNAFVQSYGSKTLDASCLRLVLAGFLPATDPRMKGTIEAIEKNLTRDGLVSRYDTGKSRDGLSGGEGTFLACSFWMVICLQQMGRVKEAHRMFERLAGLCNDVGLISEEYDPVEKRMLGNFPQALSHLALVHAAFALSGQWAPEPYSSADSFDSSDSSVPSWG